MYKALNSFVIYIMTTTHQNPSFLYSNTFMIAISQYLFGNIVNLFLPKGDAFLGTE